MALLKASSSVSPICVLISVSAPIIMEILDDLDPLEQHKLLIAGANLSLHLAYYDRIEKTWEQKARAATLEAIRIGAIVFAVASLGSATSLTVLAQNAIVAYATSIAVNAIIEQILVPIIVSNFGEDEALILLAIAAVAIAIYSSGGTTGLNQFPNQVALFTTTIDIMNQMYSLAVVQPGLIEMQKELNKKKHFKKNMLHYLVQMMLLIIYYLYKLELH